MAFDETTSGNIQHMALAEHITGVVPGAVVVDANGTVVINVDGATVADADGAVAILLHGTCIERRPVRWRR